MITPSHASRLLLALEFLVLCIGLPTVIIAYRFAPFMFAFLWGAALFCFVVLRLRHHAHLKEIWKWQAVNRANLKRILPRWAVCSIGMLAFIYFYDPGRMFMLFHTRPEIIPFLLMLYPVLSALPQEFIFCSYFFERFQPFFRTERARIIASAIVFAYAHVLFINWVAPLLSLLAGLIFADTYSRTRSLALVTIEHALYGNVLFLVGLGWYFYGGAVGMR